MHFASEMLIPLNKESKEQTQTTSTRVNNKNTKNSFLHMKFLGKQLQGGRVKKKGVHMAANYIKP